MAYIELELRFHCRVSNMFFFKTYFLYSSLQGVLKTRVTFLRVDFFFVDTKKIHSIITNILTNEFYYGIVKYGEY